MIKTQKLFLKIWMSYQNNLDKAKNQKPDDLIIKFGND